MIGRKYDVGKGHVFTIRKIYYLSHPICQDRLSLYYIINDPQISAFLCNKKCILANIIQFCSQCLSTATALHVVTQWSRLLWNGGSVFARQSCFQITVVDRETGKWYRVFFFFLPHQLSTEFTCVIFAHVSIRQNYHISPRNYKGLGK